MQKLNRFFPKLICSIIFLCVLLLASGCAHKKKSKTLTRAELESKRVAITEIAGEPESKKHVEIAIINEIIDKGRFEVVDRTTVQDALVTYPTEGDWQRLGKKVGADYILGVRVLDFSVGEREGFDKVEEEDPVLAEEAGTPGKKVTGTRYVKVKGYQGSVRLGLKFYDVADGSMVYQGIGIASENLNSRDGTFRGKMALLERLSAAAVRDFFEKLPNK